MADEYNSIDTVKLNISTNKKGVNLEKVIKQLFINKIRPYINEKADEIDTSINLSIDRFEIDLKPIKVEDINNVSQIELDQITTYFKQQFDKKLQSLLLKNTKSESTIELIQNALLNGYISSTYKSFTSSFNITNQIISLSQSDSILLFGWIKNNRNNQLIIGRLLQHLSKSQTVSFFKKIDGYYESIFKQLDSYFKKNQDYLPIRNKQLFNEAFNYFIGAKIDFNLSEEDITSQFINDQYNINIKELTLIKRDERVFSALNIKQRSEYFATAFKSYNQALVLINKYYEKEKNKLGFSKNELIIQFQNFLLLKTDHPEAPNDLFENFIKSDEPLNQYIKKSDFNFLLESTDLDLLQFPSSKEDKKQFFFAIFLNTGSFPIQLNNPSEKEVLNMLLSYTNNKPIHIRKVLLNKNHTTLWSLIRRLNNEQLLKFIHQLSPNFLFERGKFFKALETLESKKAIRLTNIEELKKEYSFNALKSLILRKQIHFNPSLKLIRNWVNQKTIQKAENFKQIQIGQASILEFQITQELKKIEPENKIIDKQNQDDLELYNSKGKSQISPVFYENILAHYLRYNNLPWWAEFEIPNIGDNLISAIQEIIIDFKNQFSSKYHQFLALVTKSTILSYGLLFQVDRTIFNFLIKDLISPIKINQINLFLEDLNIISNQFLASGIYNSALQKDIFQSIFITANNEPLDKIFDNVLTDFISISKKDTSTIIKVISKMNFSSSYFLSKSFKEHLIIVNNRLAESEISSSQSFNLESFLNEQLIAQLLTFFRTGILSGILASNKKSYENFIYDLKNDNKHRSKIIRALKQSKWPTSFFLPGVKDLFLEVQSKENNLTSSKQRNKKKAKEVDSQDLIDSDNFLKHKEGKINVDNDGSSSDLFEEGVIRELKNLDRSKEKKLEEVLLFHKESADLNLSVFNYFILNNKLPWWSPFDSIADFQVHFIISLKENSNTFFKELTNIITNEELKNKLYSFLDFKLNEPFNTQQWSKALVDELDLLITNKSIDGTIFPTLYSQFLAFKQLIYTEIAIEDHRDIVNNFIKYIVEYISWAGISNANNFIEQIISLVNSINIKLTAKINIEKALKAKRLIEEKKAKISSRDIDANMLAINQTMSRLLLDIQVVNQSSEQENPTLFLLAINQLIQIEDYNLLQEIYIDLINVFKPESKSSNFKEIFANQVQLLFFRSLFQSGKYSREVLFKELSGMVKTTQIINSDWIKDIKNQVLISEKSTQNKELKATTIIEEFKAVLNEKYPTDTVKHLKSLRQFIVLQSNLDEQQIKTTILSFMYYLSITNEKEIAPLILSFFRLKAIKNTLLYDHLLELNNVETFENFENEYADFLINLELQSLMKGFDISVFSNQASFFINETLNNLDAKRASVNAISFFIRQWARKNDISLSKAFNDIKDRLTNDNRFKKLHRLKVIISDFEINEYFNLEKDSYSRLLKDKKILESKEFDSDNFVSDLIRKIKFNNQFFEEYESFDNNDLSELSDLAFPNDNLLPKIKKGEQLQIYNAGLALIWPFVGTLFTKLGLIKGKEFIDKSKQFRAIHLLQYIIDGGDTSPEFVLIFNKLICGLPLSDPLDMFVTLTKEEKHQADQFLESIKGKWKEMKNTSLDTFRESFLQREGTLTFNDKNWKLQVESKPIDVLLRKLPWGIALIKFRWNDYIIFVEWTTKN